MAQILLLYTGMNMQKTIRKAVGFSGIGLHTGFVINVKILPSAEDTGITFIRKDVPCAPSIRAEASNVVNTSYATTLGQNGVTVSTVEHLMAAFHGLGVDNAVVELDGPEVPIMDGSSSHFIEMIEGAGLEALPAPRRYLVIKRPIRIADGDKYVALLPADEMELTVDYGIDFSHPFLTRQSFSGNFSNNLFREDIGRARTFGFLSDVEMLRKNGLAKGGSPENAIIITDTGILNEGGLRYPDEFVRHKVLDMIGDIFLLGAPVIGRLIAFRSGHSLNHRLVQEVIKKPGRWELTDFVTAAPAAQMAPELMATV
ncbi:MAG: UDP-3-O-acyl-N-acetylglucosamine deacetylase [Deltaproteobacteria bacterium]|nr:UDP-3-O-acyl-N-acetylglucosamine deacetylase [Deltaproteobacteria bacterium]